MVRFFGLIPSVGLSQFDGPLFYVGIYPDQIALKYHYFYDPLLYTTVPWNMTYQGYFDMKGFGLIPSVVLSQDEGPLFYVGVQPDRNALKYHYF